MKTSKSKLFGENRFNFYGWICGGLVVISACLWLVIRALRAGALRPPESLLLLAIYFVMLSHLGLALQSYHARVVQRIESERSKRAHDVA